MYHHDGTVLLSHGGVEMGQGLNTKMMQIASQELHVPMEIIRVTPNSTEKVYIATYRQVEKAEVRKLTYENRSTKVRRKAAYLCLLPF